MIFEGEYLYDHKRKGKSYINGKLEYEGEYVCDKKWHGEGYDKKGKKIYEVKNGKGKVREYNDIGELIFEGEYLNGRRNGKGIEYFMPGKIEFEGEFLDGKRWKGKSMDYDPDGESMFSGEYSEGEEKHNKSKINVFKII